MTATSSLVVDQLTFVDNAQELLRISSLEIIDQGLGLVVGKNGSGKTLLLHLLSGRLAPSKGKITFVDNNGRENPLNQEMVYRQKIRFIPDKLIGDHEVTLQAYLMQLSMIYHQFDIALAMTDMKQVLQMCALDRLTKVKLSRLSLGEQRRLSIACALLGKSQYLFLDEPFTGLDSHQISSMRNLLKQRAKKQGVVVSGHDLKNDAKIADYLLWVKEHHVTYHLVSEAVLKAIEEDLLHDD